MKVAVTSSGNTLDSLIDRRFGRCAFFAVFDTGDRSVEFVENSAKDAPEGAGPAAVAIVAEHGVEQVVSGEFGFKIKTLLQDLNIRMVIMKEEKTIGELVAMMKGE